MGRRRWPWIRGREAPVWNYASYGCIDTLTNLLPEVKKQLYVLAELLVEVLIWIVVEAVSTTLVMTIVLFVDIRLVWPAR